MKEASNATDNQSGSKNIEQRIRTLEDEIISVKEENKDLKTTLEQQQDSGLPTVSRRQTLGSLLGGGALLGLAGSATAQSGGNDNAPWAPDQHDHSGKHGTSSQLGKASPLESMNVKEIWANKAHLGKLNGITFLRDDLDEKTVREKVMAAEPEDVFIVEPGATWTLKDTLQVPSGINIIGGSSGMSLPESEWGRSYPPKIHTTFMKGFDGPLANIGNHVTLSGLTFNGNKMEGYQGDGVVYSGRNEDDPDTRDVGGFRSMFINCSVYYCRGDGIIFEDAAYFNYLSEVRCFQNEGWGLRQASLSGHHSQNYFVRLSLAYNHTGGVLYEGMDHSTTYQNSTINHNKGPAFEMHKPTFSFFADIFNISVLNSNIIGNQGPVWLHRDGSGTNIVFEDCTLRNNVTKPSSEREEPVGQFQVEGGKLDLAVRGGICAQHSTMYRATENSGQNNLVLTGPAQNKMTGEIYGPNTNVTVLPTLVYSGSPNVESGIGLNPKTGQVEQYGPFESPSEFVLPKRTLTVDGDLNLEDTDGLTVADDFFVYNGNPTVSGPVWMTWDSSNLYLAADLEDATHTQSHSGEKLYRGDAIQMGVAPGISNPETWSEMDIALTPDGPQTVQRTFPDPPNPTLVDFAELSINRQNGHTIYELGFPWDKLEATPDNESVRLSVAISDYDKDGRSGWLSWGGGILGGKNAAQYNKVDIGQ